MELTQRVYFRQMCQHIHPLQSLFLSREDAGSTLGGCRRLQEQEEGVASAPQAEQDSLASASL